jgi:hypothetical protein
MKKEKDAEKQEMKKEKDAEKQNIIKQKNSAILIYQIGVGIVGLTFLILFLVFGTWCCVWNKNAPERRFSEEPNEEVHISNPTNQDENSRRENFDPSVIGEETIPSIATNDSEGLYDTIDKEFTTIKSHLRNFQATFEHQEMLTAVES